MVKILHYVVLGVILLGAVYYVWTKPPSINPMIDRRSADALAMVQTHRALGYPTILQAMTEHVRSMKDRIKRAARRVAREPSGRRSL
jgi:putative copper export protein